jgi:hypothetical protein
MYIVQLNMSYFCSWDKKYFQYKRATLTINVLVVFYGAGRSDLMRANLFRGPLEGCALKIETFLRTEMATTNASLIGPKKVDIFRAHPFQWPLKWQGPRKSWINTITTYTVAGGRERGLSKQPFIQHNLEINSDMCVRLRHIKCTA